MPVKALPDPSWPAALAIHQGGYDWGVLAYAIDYGGSMIWFGSSAGVAISNSFPEAKDTGRWLKEGWHVAAAFVIGFFVMLLLAGWSPHALGRPGN